MTVQIRFNSLLPEFSLDPSLSNYIVESNFLNDYNYDEANQKIQIWKYL